MASAQPAKLGTMDGLARCVRLALAALALWLFLVSGCSQPEPWKVGFVGCLTGRLSDLGVAGRDAVLLAVEDINRAGGIRGRPVRLIVKDDQQKAEAALKADQELIDQGVVAIIGHMTSTMSLAAQPLINQAKMVMISPTSSTDKLSGRDDYFFRVMGSNIVSSGQLAGHAFKDAGVRRAAAIYDLSNRAYATGWLKGFKSAFEGLGGRIVTVKAFDSRQENDFTLLALQMLGSRPQAIVIIAGALDTAMLQQQFCRFGVALPILSSGWAMTEQFIQHGGRAAEGVLFSHSIESDSQKQGWLDFKTRFQEHFGYKPGFAAAHSYEAAMALFKALALAGSRQDLPRALVEIRNYEGLQGGFEIDSNGDAIRKRFLTVVKNGRFEVVK